LYISIHKLLYRLKIFKQKVRYFSAWGTNIKPDRLFIRLLCFYRVRIGERPFNFVQYKLVLPIFSLPVEIICRNLYDLTVKQETGEVNEKLDSLFWVMWQKESGKKNLYQTSFLTTLICCCINYLLKGKYQFALFLSFSRIVLAVPSSLNLEDTRLAK